MYREERLSFRREYDRAQQAWETAEQREVHLRQRSEGDRALETAYKLMQWGCASDWWQWEQVGLRSSELYAIQLNATLRC